MGSCITSPDGVIEDFIRLNDQRKGDFGVDV
jgi:hypothetical protein